jgi:DNA-binding FadR family transcriptional regulator
MISGNLKINQKPSLVDQVEEKLLSYFKDMSLKPGDSLPGEIKLKEALGVGRSVLREALSRFRMVGLLESKPGRGMILCEPELFNGLERVMNPHLLSREKLMDLLGFRVIIELGAVDFIFQNVTDSDIVDLEVIVNNQVVYENNQFTPQSDYEFHVRLLEIADNNSVKQFQKIVYPIFEFAKENFHEFFTNYKKAHDEDGLISHRDLFDLLKSGKKEQYRQAMKKHLDLYFELIRPKKTEE